MPLITTRIATADDLPFVLALTRRESNTLAWIPTAGVQWYLNGGHCLIAERRNTPIGYLYGRPELATLPHIRPITQLCVDPRHRRQGAATALVNRWTADARADSRRILQAWCRSDLPANALWRALGFQHVATRSPDTARRKTLLLWRAPIARCTPAQLRQLPPRAGWKATHTRARRTKPTAAR